MWVTRDKKGYGGVCLWKVKPKRGNYYWKTEYSRDDSFTIDGNLFPNLTWEDEPIEVSLIENKELELIKHQSEAWVDSFGYENEH